LGLFFGSCAKYSAFKGGGFIGRRGLKRRGFGCGMRSKKLPNACIRNNNLSLLSNN